MKTTKEVRDVRRDRVRLLLSLQFPLSKIALKLGVSRRTIFYDIKQIRKDWGVQIKTIDLEQLIAEIMFDLNNRRRELYKILDESKNDYIKLGAIAALGKENDRIINLLQSVGKVNKVPDEIKGTFVFEFGDHGSPGDDNDGQDEERS